MGQWQASRPGEGEITDIDVKNGIVYATGLDENMDAVYWIDGVKTQFKDLKQMLTLYLFMEKIYVAGSFLNGLVIGKMDQKLILQ